MLGFEGTTWACLLQAWPALRGMWGFFSGAEAFSSHGFSWATQRHMLRITKKDYYLVFYHIRSHPYCGLHVSIFRENTHSEADIHKDHDFSSAVDSTEPCLSQSFEWQGHPRITFGSQYMAQLHTEENHPWSAFWEWILVLYSLEATFVSVCLLNSWECALVGVLLAQLPPVLLLPSWIRCLFAPSSPCSLNPDIDTLWYEAETRGWMWQNLSGYLQRIRILCEWNQQSVPGKMTESSVSAGQARRGDCWDALVPSTA